jgi:DEAD/DEAH box helicase domain-containing protein
MCQESARKALDRLTSDQIFMRNVTQMVKLPAVEAVYAELPDTVDQRLIRALATKGIDRLYSHQAQSYSHARAGRHFVVVTPTASGKSLCYSLPVLNALLADDAARAMYLFPTKALSQDQQADLNATVLGAELGIKVATYDGDTPSSIRISARDTGRIVITNPDMLHSGILPNHSKWVRFFSGLKYVVIDELHTYRGIFGSHVANVIRRLLRIAAFYSASPTIIACSATIGNPQGHFKAVTGLSGEIVDKNGAPRSGKTLLFYNPPIVDPVQGIRKGVANESTAIAVRLLKEGIQTILFARSRLKVELIASYINSALENMYTDNRGIRVEPYRSGLLPSERREIERGLREGSVHGVVSTNALELGIDIGALDAAVIAGFPGSFASFWQQSGRAGRRSGESMAVFVASSSPLDQYVVTHPEFFTGGAPETARVDPDNPYVYTDHVKCACFELPFYDGEVFGPDPASVLEMLEEEGIVRHAGGRWFWSSEGYPSEAISLRSATADNIVIIDTTLGRNEVIGEMDRPSAKELIYDDAVYLHRGRQFVVLKLDIENRECRVIAKETNYYTDAVTKTDIKVLSEDVETPGDRYRSVCGDVLVRTEAEKFKKLKFETHENVGFGEISLEPEEMQTRYIAVIFQTGSPLDGWDEAVKAAVLSGCARVAREIASMFLMCDTRDLGVAARTKDEHFLAPVILLFDKYPGGTGLSDSIPPIVGQLWSACLSRLLECPCASGCPSCIGADFFDHMSTGQDASIKDLAKAFLAHLAGASP